MADDLPLPSAAACLTPAIEALVADNPARLEHVNYGVGNWSNVLAGWKAQANLNLRRVADEMKQARLALASGRGLRELASGKFLANVVDVPTRAIGQIAIKATKGTGTSGVVPRGTRFRRSADPRAFPIPIQAADFVSLAPVYVVDDTSKTFYVPVQCVQTGTAGNIPIARISGVAPGADIQLADSLFEPFVVVSATCAGGGTSFSDDEVRAIASAQPQGRRGPTDGALRAGALLALGVRHVAVFTDLSLAQTVLYVADESWASDLNYWQPAVVQALVGDGTVDAWAGFGCSINPSGVAAVENVYLNVAATIQLRSQSLLQQTAAVQAKIEAKLRGYFELRPDWYTFRASAVRALIARADPRVLTCSSVAITDSSGQAVADPAAIPYGTAPTALTHYAFFSLTPTFVAPS